jgi:peptide/nickel transport system permease protein
VEQIAARRHEGLAMQTVRYWLVRIAQSVFVLWAAFTVSFVVLYELPSNPVALFIGQNGQAGALDSNQVKQLNAEYGFDRSVPSQYLDRLWHFLQFDFGTSIQQQQPVTTIVRRALPATLELSVMAFAIAIVLGLSTAVVASSTRVPFVRQLVQSLPPLALSLPTFWVGLVLLELFSFKLHWFPSFGNNGLRSLVLPAITLAIPVSAAMAQVLTKSFLGTWRQPFVQVAEAKGLGRSRLLSRHVLRNAVIPTLTIAAIVFGNVLGGTVITETVFSRAGIGRLTQQAVAAQDIPVVQFVVVFSALIFVVVNLLVDALYPVIDPRIRRRGLGAGR